MVSITAFNRGRRRAWCVVVVALLALVVSVGLPFAEPAEAALTNVFPADGTGEIYPDFTQDDALFAYVLSDIQGGRVCVVRETGPASCDDVAWGEPNAVVGIGTVFTLVEGPDLPRGTYRLHTENKFGDGWLPGATSDVFTIDVCRVDCELGIGRRQADAFKDMARGAGLFNELGCAGFAVKNAIGTIKATAEIAKDVRALTVGPSIGASVLLGGGFALSMIEIPSSEGVALKILEDLMCMASQMYADIAHDPPDPDLHVVEPPVFLDPPDLGSAPIDDLADALDRQTGYGIATRIVYERYQGAVAAGDLAAQRIQAAAAGENAEALAHAQRVTADALRAAAESGDVAIVGDTLESQAERDALHGAAQRVVTQGFTAGEITQLHGLGVDDTGIANLRTWFDLPIGDLVPEQPFADLLEEIADDYDAAVDPTDAFARHALAISSTDLAPPTAGITETFLTNTTRRFTATGTSSDGDPVAHHWDFGDGTSADGAEVEHTFTAGGQFTVTVTTTETSPWGSSATATSVAGVGPLNNTPQPTQDFLGVGLGQTVSFDLFANDLDQEGDSLELVGITDAQAGTIDCESDGLCSYAADKGLIGTEHLVYQVTDGTSTAASLLHVEIYPSAAPQTADISITMPAGANVEVDVPANDPEPGPDVLTPVVLTQGTVVTAAPVPQKTRLLISVPNGAAPGVDTATFRLTDGAQVSATATVTVTIVGTNQPPVAPDLELVTPKGTPIPVNLPGFDPDGNPLNYGIFTNPSVGTLSGTAPNLVYDPANAATGTVVSFQYGANDGQQFSDVGTVTIEIGPVPGGPIVDLGEDLSLNEGFISFSATARDPDGGALSYLWNFGDGRTTTAPDPFVAFDDGVYHVTLTVTDSLDRSSSDSVDLTIRNRPPQLSDIASLGFPFLAGQVSTFGVSAQDFGGDALEWKIEFSDGEVITDSDPAVSLDNPGDFRNQNLQHIFPTPGDHWVRMTVTDDDGATASRFLAVHITAPVADAGPDRTVPEGSYVTFTGNGTTHPPTWTWDFADGSTASDVEEVTHRWKGDEPRTVSLTVGFAGTTATDEATVEFSNLPPTIGPAVPLVVEAGALQHLLAGAADAGDDAVTVVWDLGDGAVAAGQVVDHTWGGVGAYTVRITATDDEGASAESIVTVNVVPPGTLGATTVDSRGRSFHLAFDRNNDWDQAEQYLVITGERNTTGVVSVPGIGFRADFSIAGAKSVIVRLPRDVTREPQPGESAFQWITSVDPHAVIVHARDEVTVYGVNHQPFTTDAFLALPDDVASTETRVIGYAGNMEEIDVVAISHDTRIMVGGGVDETIGHGDVLRIFGQSASAFFPEAFSSEATGLRITADKPVQVLTGDKCAGVDGPFCDHLVEAVLPSSMWGRRFLTVPLATRLGDKFRVVADVDGTEVRVDGELVATLDAGRLHELFLDEPAEITTSAPALVAQYSRGTVADGREGDPFMMLVPPFEQWLDRYTVASVAGMPRHYLNLVIRDGEQDSVRVDGAPVDDELWMPIGDSDYVGAQVEVDVGEHRATADRPFALFAYGFGPFESYGYPGGMATAPVAKVAALELSPTEGSRQVDTVDCPVATVTDELGAPLAGVRVDLDVAGVNPSFASGQTDGSGDVPLCFEGHEVGADDLVASVGGISATAARVWQQEAPPGTPTANDVSVTTEAGTPIEVVLDGSDPDDDVLTYDITTQPEHGLLGPVVGDRVTYTPSAGFTGEDTFSYTADDGESTSPPATVTITVEPAPAVPATVTLDPEDATHEIGDEDCTDVTVLDSEDVAMPGVEVTITRTGANPGADLLTTGADGSAEHCYTGEASGDDTIVATAGVVGAQATRTWTEPPPGSITVVKDATPDNAQDFTFSFTGRSSFFLDDDADGTLPDEKEFEELAAGDYTIAETLGTPGWALTEIDCGDADVDVDLEDGTAVVHLGSGDDVTCTFENTERGSITIVKDSVPDHAQDFDFTTEGEGLTGFSLDDDAETTLPNAIAFGGLLPGEYTATEGAVGGWALTKLECTGGDVDRDIDQRQVVVDLAAGDDVTCTYTNSLLPVNHAPSATAQSVSTPEDTANVITMAGSDEDGDGLTYSIVSGPSHGDLSGSGASRTYTPDANYHGADSFTFEANDGQVDSSTATVSITVTPVNDAPSATAQSVSTPEDTAKAIALSGSDLDGDGLSFSVVSGPSHGGLSGSGAGRTYTPDVNYHGSDSFTFKVNDGTVDSSTATVSIEVTAANDAPSANGQSVSTPEDTAKGITLTGNDLDGDGLSFTVVSGPSHGELSGGGAARTYTPNPHWHGSDAFTFKVNDGTADSQTATVDVTVTPVNDPPSAISQSVSTGEGTATDITLAASDVDGDALDFVIVDGPANGQLEEASPASEATAAAQGASSWVYTPTPGFSGTDSISFIANDGLAESPPATVEITVTASDTPPPDPTPPDPEAAAGGNTAAAPELAFTGRGAIGTQLAASLLLLAVGVALTALARRRVRTRRTSA